MRLSAFIFFGLVLTLGIFSSCEKDVDDMSLEEFLEIVEDSTCLYIYHPIYLTMPDQSIFTYTEGSYPTYLIEQQAIRDWYANNPNETELPELHFPITVKYTPTDDVFTVNNFKALQAARISCD